MLPAESLTPSYGSPSSIPGFLNVTSVPLANLRLWLHLSSLISDLVSVLRSCLCLRVLRVESTRTIRIGPKCAERLVLMNQTKLEFWTRYHRSKFWPIWGDTYPPAHESEALATFWEKVLAWFLPVAIDADVDLKEPHMSKFSPFCAVQ